LVARVGESGSSLAIFVEVWSSTLDEREQIRIDPAMFLVAEGVRTAAVSSGA
jgi:hypothetical protein